MDVLHCVTHVFRSLWFSGNLKHGAVNIKHPAVIATAYPMLFASTEFERCASMGAFLVDQSVVAGKIPKEHQFFSEDTDQFGQITHFISDMHRVPVPSQQFAAGGIGAHLSQFPEGFPFPVLVITAIRAGQFAILNRSRHDAGSANQVSDCLIKK